MGTKVRGQHPGLLGASAGRCHNIMTFFPLCLSNNGGLIPIGKDSFKKQIINTEQSTGTVE
jgi:hypothetical protein